MATTWRRSQIEDEKARIKAELSEKFPRIEDAELGFKYQLEMALADPQLGNRKAMISQFVFIVKVLIHHKTAGGLLDHQVAGLTKLARQILRHANIPPQGSSLSYLYGEIEYVISQISRVQNLHWKSLWGLCIASLHMGEDYPGGNSQRDFTIALQEMRLGDCASAIKTFESVESESTKFSEVWLKSRICRIKCLRLMRKFKEAKLLCHETMGTNENQVSLSSSYQMEFEWELRCCESMESGQYEKLLDLFKAGTHKEEMTYAVEAFFWCSIFQASPKVRVPKMRTLLRYNNAETRRLGTFFEAALALEKLEDDSVPITFRLQSLGEVLNDANGLISIDKELLVMAAAIGWLRRQKLWQMATIVTRNYSSLSRRISLGETENVLAIDTADESVK